MNEYTSSSDESSQSRGAVSLASRLDDIETVLEEIRDQMATGGRNFAVMGLRIRALEVIVYGGCAIVLIAVLSAILVLTIRQSPGPSVISVTPGVTP